MVLALGFLLVLARPFSALNRMDFAGALPIGLAALYLDRKLNSARSSAAPLLWA